VSKSKSGKTGVGTKPDATTETEVNASAGDRVDDVFDLPVVDEDTVLTAGAADATDLEEQLKELPRILRVALLINRNNGDIHDRLVADIETMSPDLPLTAAFATSDDPATALALAKELDRLAVADDVPELRHIADCVRLLCLPMQKDLAGSEDYRRVTQSLLNALARLPENIDAQLGSDIEAFCIGWAMIPALKHRLPHYRRGDMAAATHASFLGDLTATRRVEAAEATIWTNIEARTASQGDKAEDADDQPAPRVQVPQSSAPGPNQCVVARLSEREMKSPRLKELLAQFDGVINTALPLVVPPPLEEVRKQLLFEFPYAQNVIDAVLADLIGRPTVLVRPTLIVGEPGAGKTLIVRRIAEILGIYCWRTDASRTDSTVFAGTDRRWNSAEPCHPFLAIVRARHANPMILLDELEKAGGMGSGTSVPSNGGGRLWDCLLGLLESESSLRYPDPMLQTNVDLSRISFMATANSVASLPRPLLDRFRVIRMGVPSRDHLEALLPAVVADLARERGLDAKWIPMLDGVEHAAVASAWPGGSVRTLRRLVDLILHDRDARATRN
jgi:ATP-dependent Lon protease